ncbi:uncharacterized protein LOC127285422 [Leptopilina boulardi]|uniref:uncharacterized protein LOC127285422 n=1 Tax=Leptopilina boulardi TaxID=63433 RepID=UPI0021F60F60|nr:uncharacterized protein LOC127285422 [Leptopilina boulardi]
MEHWCNCYNCTMRRVSMHNLQNPNLELPLPETPPGTPPRYPWHRPESPPPFVELESPRTPPRDPWYRPVTPTPEGQAQPQAPTPEGQARPVAVVRPWQRPLWGTSSKVANPRG